MSKVIKFPKTPIGKKPFHDVVNESTRKDREDYYKRFAKAFGPNATETKAWTDAFVKGREKALNEQRQYGTAPWKTDSMIAAMAGMGMDFGGKDRSAFQAINGNTGEVRSFDTFDEMMAFAAGEAVKTGTAGYCCAGHAAKDVCDIANVVDAETREMFPALFNAIDGLRAKMEE